VQTLRTNRNADNCRRCRAK